MALVVGVGVALVGLVQHLQLLVLVLVVLAGFLTRGALVVLRGLLLVVLVVLGLMVRGVAVAVEEQEESLVLVVLVRRAQNFPLLLGVQQGRVVVVAVVVVLSVLEE